VKDVDADADTVVLIVDVADAVCVDEGDVTSQP
jgi:hypothetical protein